MDKADKQPTITQADREAAEAVYPAFLASLKGEDGGYGLAEAFARHRTTSLAAQDGLVEALRAGQDRIVGLMAAIKQGRSSTPRCEPPSKWDKDWCLDQFGLVVAALEALSAIKEQHHDANA